ncbi:MAG: flagellar hook-associated protein FlgK [Ignavibacteriae bacterium]|nr:flagellar hook-associated protein FlgK [Ignavibacteriota bacterium]
MSGISQVLEIARRALLAQQYQMNVTGHNIANASTPGYSRQRANVVTTSPTESGGGMLGTGVMVQSVDRLRNRFIDTQIRSSNDAYGQASQEYQILSQIEATYNEPDAGLNTTMSSFFSAWHSLVTHPEDSVTRNSLMLAGKNVTNVFHRLNTEMSSLRTSLRDEIQAKLDRINTLTSEIGDLNLQLTAANVSGVNTGDMRDTIGTKLEELSGLANISASEGPNGTVSVMLGSVLIADNGGSHTLKISTSPNATIAGSSFDQLRVTTELGVETQLSGGETGGLLKSYNTTIPDALGRLDRLAEALVSEVNKYHATGYGLQEPPQTGINFFSGSGAASIEIDLTDTSGGAQPGSNASLANIAAASVAGASGNNDIALLIASAFDKKSLTTGGGASLLGGLSISAYYNQSVTWLGSAINSADTVMQSQEQVLTQLNMQRDAVSGVSLDEEMTNMIKFQRAFDAAAKLVNTADEMFQTILNMV